MATNGAQPPLGDNAQHASGVQSHDHANDNVPAVHQRSQHSPSDDFNEKTESQPGDGRHGVGKDEPSPSSGHEKTNGNDLEAAASRNSNHAHRRPKLSFAQRSIRITWAWFPASLSTGSISILLSIQPYTFTGLVTIGKIFYIVSLIMFLALLSLIIARFVRKPRAISTSLHHPSESFFFGGFWTSVALVIYGMQVYGVPACGPWLVQAVRVLFWIYYACAMIVAVLQYHVIFEVEKMKPGDAMPVWIFPAYPFLVTGVLASSIAKTQPQQAAIELIVGGLAGQGLGWILAFMVYTVYLTRLIHNDMPDASVRPGMYMSVGPAAYTCAGLLTLGKQAMSALPPDFLGVTSLPVGELWYAVAVPAALFLWLIAIWFSALSTVSVFHSIKKMSFALQWWSFIFPNVGLATATIRIGEALNSKPIKIAGSVVTVIMIPLWFMCIICQGRAIWNRELLAPGKDVGVDDVNYKHDVKAERSKMKKLARRETREGGRSATF